jgi:hypothetical protein
MFPFFHYLRHSSGFKPVTSWDSSYLDFATESKEYKRSLLLHFVLYHNGEDFTYHFLKANHAVLPLKEKNVVEKI